MNAGLGDKVRFKITPLTLHLELAGEVGTIYGESVPSGSGVPVEGPCPDDYALNVVVDGRPRSVWIAPDHVERVDSGGVQEITIGTKRFVRSASGEWVEQSRATD